MNRDYYKVLGVQKSASEDEIKKAYRRLAHQHHPDKAGGDEKKFKEISEAYQILSDKKKRTFYDKYGQAEPAGFGAGQNPFGGFSAQGGFGGFSGGHGHGFNGQEFSFSDLGDMGEMFESFFEDMGVKPRRRTYQRGSDVEILQEITLEEAFRGAVKNLKIKLSVSCNACKGQGSDTAAGSKTCDACNGQGEVREKRDTFFGSFSQIKPCGRCRGSGKIPNKMCAACKGSGRLSGERSVELEILPGVQNEQIIKVKGAGEAGELGTPTGDLYIRIRVKTHPAFERRGDDLVVKKELNVFDLLLGKKIEVGTVSGGKLSVEIPSHFNLKDDLRISGEGMPHFGSFGRGDLLVNFIIKAPKKLDARIKKVLEDLGQTEL
ncbi:MAG: DnaJ domain-containing protein [Candidatus Liptonbacteria bacterium]|nr:DnaJ domain-containing protein [Candidatus Liptonbacteria bacterium]